MQPDAPKLEAPRLAKWRRRLTRLPRRLHVYGVGTPKSGTTSMAHMLKAYYRTKHEPRVEALLSYLAADARTATREEKRAFLRARDRALRLEVESNQLLCYFAEDLADLFPRAQFIHPIRDCYTFLESVLNHRLTRARGGWAPYDKRWADERAHTYAEEEAYLEERALPPVAHYFRMWSRMNQAVLDGVPEDRRLSIRTPDIHASAGRFADFLSIPLERIDRGRSHRNVAGDHVFDLSLIDSDFLEACAKEHCAPLMRRFFPEIKRPPTRR